MLDRRIVLGLGGTVDHELRWDAGRVQELAFALSVTIDEIEDDPSSSVDDRRSALIYLLQMMHRGRGGECHVGDPFELAAFDAVFRSTTTLGGTCVRAAIAMDRIGIPSFVHLVSINDDFRRLLPLRVETVSSARSDSLEPHVIIQYPADARIRVIGGEVASTRPNRVILVNDRPNELMELSPALADAFATASAVLISGFNTMKSVDLLRERIELLLAMLDSVPEDCPVVYEDAGFHDDRMRAIILESLPRAIHLHSLNEDEASTYLNRPLRLDEAGGVVEAMLALRTRLGAPAVLMHTSRFAAVIGEDADRIVRAAAAGCQMASTRFAFGDDFAAEDFSSTASAPLDEVGLRIRECREIREAGIRIAPSYDLRTENPTTIGLGDSFIGGLMADLGGAL